MSETSARSSVTSYFTSQSGGPTFQLLQKCFLKSQYFKLQSFSQKSRPSDLLQATCRRQDSTIGYKLTIDIPHNTPNRLSSGNGNLHIRLLGQHTPATGKLPSNMDETRDSSHSRQTQAEQQGVPDALHTKLMTKPFGFC